MKTTCRLCLSLIFALLILSGSAPKVAALDKGIIAAALIVPPNEFKANISYAPLVFLRR